MNTLRDLRQGALLHVLVALLAARPRALSKAQLADETAWSHERIEDATRILAERFGVIIPVPNPGSKWPRWQLAPNAHLQLPLILAFTPGPVSAGIAQSTSSSSSYEDSLIEESFTEQLLLPPVSAGIAQSTTDLSTDQAELSTAYPHNHPHAERAHVVDMLVAALKALGCPEARAVAAVIQALNRGESAQAVAEKIMAGKAYAASPAGRTIRQPGPWLAACLADGRAIPAPREGQAPDWERDYSGYLPYADNACPEPSRRAPDPEADADAAGDTPCA